MQIKIVTKVLTDGSKVHDVLLIQDEQVIRLPAYDKSHARSLVGAISNAVEDFTTELVD
jgi:hypothetical protein